MSHRGPFISLRVIASRGCAGWFGQADCGQCEGLLAGRICAPAFAATRGKRHVHRCRRDRSHRPGRLAHPVPSEEGLTLSRRGHGTWRRALRVDRGGRDNRPGRLINWLTAAARSVAVQLELLLRPDLSVEPFGPVGPSAPSTTRAI
jgi:hypothetical protein